MRNTMLSAPIRPRITRLDAAEVRPSVARAMSPGVAGAMIPSVAGAMSHGVAEAMIADARGHLTPAELVEQKIASTLKTSPLPISSLRTRTTMRRPK